MLLRDIENHEKFVMNECNKHNIPETPFSSLVISSDGPVSSSNIISYELALMGYIKEKFSKYCLSESSIDLDPSSNLSKEDLCVETKKLDAIEDRSLSFHYYTKSLFLGPQSVYNFPFHTWNYHYVPPESNAAMYSTEPITSDNSIKIIYYSNKFDDYDFVIVDPDDLQDVL